METFNRNVKFKVSLSNGLSFYEGKSPYELIAGERAPWIRLKKFLETMQDISITSLSLYTDKGQVWNLPSAGTNPKFRAFANLEKPLQFKYERIFAKDVQDGSDPGEVLVCIQAIYKNFVLKLFVSEEHPENSWVLAEAVANG